LGCEELKLPKTIGRLTSLETLEWVNIWGHDDVIDNNKEVFKLSDLRNMDQLKGKLVIEWMNEEWKDAASDADMAKLVNKKHLLSLVLRFPQNWKSESVRSMIHEEILSASQPNPNLESLDIQNYSGTTLCPHWMKNMNNLTSLTFVGCGVWEFVPLSVLGNLGSLETLRFEFMDGVKKVEFENSTSSSSLEQVLFPSLKHLQFINMPEWEEWSDLDQESDCAMPF
jgi:Leucine-rich repeat (LRR) protein